MYSENLALSCLKVRVVDCKILAVPFGQPYDFNDRHWRQAREILDRLKRTLGDLRLATGTRYLHAANRSVLL